MLNMDGVDVLSSVFLLGYGRHGVNEGYRLSI